MSYISPRTINKLINVIGKNIIQKYLVDEVQSAKHFSIMVEEITSSNEEVIPLCAWFVESGCDSERNFCRIPF